MPIVSGQKAYERLFDAGLNAYNVEALGKLFPYIGIGSCRQ
jgi:hypothetical protein